MRYSRAQVAAIRDNYRKRRSAEARRAAEAALKKEIHRKPEGPKYPVRIILGPNEPQSQT